MIDRTWDVLAILGPSGSGKSTAAEIARRSGIPWIQVDDLRLALQYSSVTLPAQTEALYAFEDTPGVRGIPVEQQVAMYIGVAEVMRAAVRVVIDSHLATNVPMVIEGDGIHPDLVEDPVLKPHLASGRLKFVCIAADSVDELVRNSMERGRGEQFTDQATARKHVVGAHAYGSWLARACQEREVPVIASQPLPTLGERIALAARA